MKMFRGAAVAAAVAGSTFAFNAQAVNLAQDGVGEVAIAPFYTVRDGWSTLINLTNTQNVPVVVKVRFHEALNSRDVLDFNVALSAYDVFTGIVRLSADGVTPEFVSTDTPNAAGRKTCTIPSIVGTSATGVKMLTGGYQGVSGDDDTGPLGADRLSEGYVEFIVMGYAEGTKTGNLDADGSYVDEAGSVAAPNGLAGNTIEVIHVGNAIEQHECALLDIAFNDAVNASSEDLPLSATPGVANVGQSYILDTARQFGEPLSALKFNFRLLNPARGVEAGNSATTWANFYNPGLGVAPGPDGVALTFDDTFVTPVQNVDCGITRGDERLSSSDAGSVGRGAAEDWVPNQAIAVGSSCLNLITAQREYAFLEPSLNDAWPVQANWWEDSTNAVLNFVPAAATAAVGLDLTPATADDKLRGVDALSATIMRQTVVNEWSNNNSQGVSTDWIVTFPTKGFYVDRDVSGTGTTNGLQAAIVTERAPEADRGTMDTVDSTPGAGVFPADAGATVTNPLDGIPDAAYPPFQKPFFESVAGANDGKACSEISFVYYDRAEQKPTAAAGGVIVSPAPPQTIATDNLCYEANVITFNGISAFADAGSQTAKNRVNVDTSALVGAQSGWMLLTLDDFANASIDGTGSAGLPAVAIGGAAVASTHVRGLPAIGFNLKVRNFGSADANYASTLDHGYLRGFSNN